MEAELIAHDLGHKTSTASRKMRELCREGKLERELRPMITKPSTKTVWYRYVPEVVPRPPSVPSQYAREITREETLFKI